MDFWVALILSFICTAFIGITIVVVHDAIMIYRVYRRVSNSKEFVEEYQKVVREHIEKQEKKDDA